MQVYSNGPGSVSGVSGGGSVDWSHTLSHTSCPDILGGHTGIFCNFLTLPLSRENLHKSVIGSFINRQVDRTAHKLNALKIKLSYCGQLTNERAQFLFHSFYEPSCLLVHGFIYKTD